MNVFSIEHISQLRASWVIKFYEDTSDFLHPSKTITITNDHTLSLTTTHRSQSKLGHDIKVESNIEVHGYFPKVNKNVKLTRVKRGRIALDSFQIAPSSLLVSEQALDHVPAISTHRRVVETCSIRSSILDSIKRTRSHMFLSRPNFNLISYSYSNFKL